MAEMCVALPGRVVWIGERSATSIPARIDVGSHEAPADLAMVPQAEVGDYVIAHSGFAIRLVETTTAEQVRAQLGITD
ncbi:MAG: HypC/HybG/HupF family hydrogenase formation chaperone [Acidimicrobiia bacterium]|nr:HypC/HybG/HupF family hydrogenase formation chaperone [Acidimicrobiia bacterium]